MTIVMHNYLTKLTNNCLLKIIMQKTEVAKKQNCKQPKLQMTKVAYN